MPIAVVLIVLVVGSLVFHFLSPWTFTPIASNWGMIDSTVDITFVVTGIVFVAVNLFLAYAIIRYRHRPGLKANYEPENKKLEIWLTVLTTIGVAAMLTPGLFVWAKFVAVPEGAIEIEAIAQQWKWTYRLPGRDGEFGIVDAKLIGVENPFGIDPDDPNGSDDVLVDDATVHIPLGVQRLADGPCPPAGAAPDDTFEHGYDLIGGRRIGDQLAFVRDDRDRLVGPGDR